MGSSIVGLDLSLWYSQKKIDLTPIKYVIAFIFAAFTAHLGLIADRPSLFDLSFAYLFFALALVLFAFSLARSRLNFFARLIHSYSALGLVEKTDEASEARDHVMEMKKHSLRAVCFGVVLYLGVVALFIKYPLTDLLTALSKLRR